MAGNTTGLSISLAIRAGTHVLQEAGVDAAAVEARLLMAYALGSARPAEHGVRFPKIPVSSTELFVRGDEPAPAVYERWLRYRVQRQPLQHIVGAAVFDGLDFLSTPAGFIPRPETELMVHWAKRWIDVYWRKHEASELGRTLLGEEVCIVDLCSGPGTLALALAASATDNTTKAAASAHNGKTTATPAAHERHVKIIGMDIDSEALELARANERQLRARGLITPQIDVRFIQMDVCDPQQIGRLGLVAQAQLILANPPYVPQKALQEGLVSPEVRADPYHAVFAGSEGMDLMQPLAQCMSLLAAPVAAVAVEHDDSTGALVQGVLHDAGMHSVQQHQDLAGRDRFVSARITRDPGVSLATPVCDRGGRSRETLSSSYYGDGQALIDAQDGAG